MTLTSKYHYHKATPSEIEAYAAAGGLYPLHAVIIVDELTAHVERLPFDPRYELMAPAGYVTKANGTHSQLEASIDDIRSAALMGFERCTDPDCDSCIDRRAMEQVRWIEKLVPKNTKSESGRKAIEALENYREAATELKKAFWLSEAICHAKDFEYFDY